jgi:hypothetical protein
MKNFGLKITVLLLSVAASSSVLADVPAAATTALTSVQTDGMALIDAGWPILAGITGAFVLMKLFKRVVSRAS